MTGVMQITDSLETGGLERVAVSLGNLLPRDRFRSSLCVTRRSGPLADAVAPHVARLFLNRSGRFDWRAVRALVSFIRTHDVALLHAHGTSLFIAAVASLFSPYPAVVWHDHFGAYRISRRPAAAYRVALGRAAGVIVVNPELGEWARRLGVRADRIWYVPNFASESRSESDGESRLPGAPGKRVVCVAKLRRQKDHCTLVRAWALAVRDVPDAHLLIVGSGTDAAYTQEIEAEIGRLQLGGRVTLLGERSDVPSILRQCDIGVLSSASEGLPLALIEYGTHGLAAIATDVGQCAAVLDSGTAGVLVEPGNPEQLAAAIVRLLNDEAGRLALGRALNRHVAAAYRQQDVIDRICAIYDRCRRPRVA